MTSKLVKWVYVAYLEYDAAVKARKTSGSNPDKSTIT